MKTIISCFLLLISCFSMAQDWAPIGATWYYTEGFPFSPNIDYFKIESVKDTVILGKTCRKMVKRNILSCTDRPFTEYTYIENNKVYFLDTVFNSFQVLYDFGADAGGQWMIKVKNYANPPDVDTIFIRVDSTTTVLVNGFPLKKQYLTYDFHNEMLPGYTGYTYNVEIIETIGDIGYMFNWMPNFGYICDGNFSDGLRCYEDSIIGLYETGIADSCDYVYVGIRDQELPGIELYPNPVHDVLKVHSSKSGPASFQILDVSGSPVSTGIIENDRIQAGNLTRGMYFLELYDRNGKLLACKKFLKD